MFFVHDVYKGATAHVYAASFKVENALTFQHLEESIIFSEIYKKKKTNLKMWRDQKAYKFSKFQNKR